MRARNLSKHSPKMSLLFRQLVTRAGKKPPHPTKDLEGYSFWVGNLLPTSRGDRQSEAERLGCPFRGTIAINFDDHLVVDAEE